MLLITGGAGFIGSNFILDWLAHHDEPVTNLDALTYAGNLENLSDLRGDVRHRFIHGSVADAEAVADAFDRARPRAVIHFAAESHVDRSISGPKIFIETNVLGTATMLDAAKRYWESLPPSEKSEFRFINISTDEVYGFLTPDASPAVETTPFDPSSPYSASKAAADQLGRAYARTYGLPVITVRSTNNYGPRQYCEKLTPSVIQKALAREPIPIYGSGRQIRDWIHVSDFCRALERILEGGAPGEIYNVGAENELANIDYVRCICGILDELAPHPGGSYADLIRHVADRPGHDVRYGLNPEKLRRTLGWKPKIHFYTGLRDTVDWYLGGVKEII